MTITQTHHVRKNSKAFRKPSHIFVWQKGEGIIENLMNRRCRPHTVWRKLITAKLADLGLPADVRLSWSQKCGCSCGCSPGFRLTREGRPFRHLTPDGVTDIHLTVE